MFSSIHGEVLSTVEVIQSSGGQAEALISDVSDFDAVSKTISAFGSSRQSIDILCLRNMRDIVSSSSRHFMITQRIMNGLDFREIADLCGIPVAQIERIY